MRTIYKYPLPIKDKAVIDMPVSARVLTVQMQNTFPHIWAVVDPEEETGPRSFVIRGTGHPFRGGEDLYVGTYQTPTGLVFHVFEVKR